MSLDKLALSRRCLLIFLVLLSLNETAIAEDAAQSDTVLTRIRSELNPLGIRVGSFFVYPQVTFTETYDDNIFATNNNNSNEASRISEISPEVSAHSSWGNHGLNLSATADIGRFSDFSSEDYEDWEIAADGRLDIMRNIGIYAGTSVKQNHANRSSPDETVGLKPTQHKDTSVFSGYSHQMGMFRVELNTALTKIDYDDVLAVRNGSSVVINQDDRDRTEYTASLRGSYRMLNDYEAFMLLRRERRDYDELQDFINADRSSDAYEATIGITPLSIGVVSGSISAGYLVQNYNDPFSDISAPTFDVSLDWNVTTLTTVSFDLQRSIRETTSALFSGYVSNNAFLNVDHELHRNLLLNAGLNYISDNYEGNRSTEQRDLEYNLHVETTYMISRHLYVSVLYRNIQRERSGSANTPNSSGAFKKNIILIQLQTQI